MQKGVATSFAAMSMAATIVFLSAYAAQSGRYRDDRADRPPLLANQIVDRADARIAELKAELRLSADQAKLWPGLESALHEIATKRAVRMANKGAPQTGRSSAESPEATGQPAGQAAGQAPAAQINSEPDDIAAMQKQADVLTAQSADLRQISAAAEPLYQSFDDRQRRLFMRFVHSDIRADEMENSPDQRR